MTVHARCQSRDGRESLRRGNRRSVRAGGLPRPVGDGGIHDDVVFFFGNQYSNRFSLSHDPKAGRNGMFLGEEGSGRRLLWFRRMKETGVGGSKKNDRTQQKKEVACLG